MTTFLTVIISALDFVEPLKGDLLPLNLYGPLEIIIKEVKQKQLFKELSRGQLSLKKSKQTEGLLVSNSRDSRESMTSSDDLSNGQRLGEQKCCEKMALASDVVKVEMLTYFTSLCDVMSHLWQKYQMNKSEVKSQDQQAIQSKLLLEAEKVTSELQIFRSKVKEYRDTRFNQKKINQNNIQNQIKIGEVKNIKQKMVAKSLLTENLKKISFTSQEKDYYCNGGKVVIKSNEIMKEMKKHKKETMTQPMKKISNPQETSSPLNVRSFQPQHLSNYQVSPKIHRSSVMSIRAQMSVEDNRKEKQRKSKKDEMGCSRCDIY